MRFNELEASPLKPFQDFISVKRAKELDLIPQIYSTVFADDCGCGSERMARLSGNDGAVTGITCCDPRCPIKMSYQLTTMFERFGYKGIGKATCTKVVQDFMETGEKFDFADILIRGDKVISLTGAIGARWGEAMDLIRSSKQNLGSMIYKWSFPGLGSKFEDIMHGISSVSQLAEIIRAEGYFQFFSKRGVKSLTTLWYFREYLSEISKLSTEFKDCITISLDKVLAICMTGRMQSSLGNLTKKEYLNLCSTYLEQRNLSDPFEIKAVDTVSKATFVIAGEDSVAGKTSKYRQALEKEKVLKVAKNDPNYKVLFSPDEFLALILGKE